MMKLKRSIQTLAATAAALASVACSNYRIIPDKTLASIFHDAFLVNAYIENNRVPTDSTDIYRPIFEKYGYTTEDVQYTIGNFSKRKSARLGDVVEEAIKQLEEEGLYYEQEAAVLDTIDNAARRAFTRTVYSDSLIRVSKLKDTDRLHIVIDGIRAGEYKVSYEYKVDSLDSNVSRRSTFEFARADSTRFGRQQQTVYKSASPERVNRTLTADTSARTLHINLMSFTQPVNTKERKHTGITVTGLTVTRVPSAEEAVDSLFESQMPIRIFFRDFFGIPEPAVDSLAVIPADSLAADAPSEAE